MHSSFRSEIPPFIVMDVMKKAAMRQGAGLDVLHMEVGQPSTAVPSRVLEAVDHTMHSDKMGYTVALGLPELREKISRHYLHFYGSTVAPERIAVTSGSSGGFVLTFLAAFDSGARVAVAEPGYPCYRNILTSLGLVPVGIPVGPETRYQVTPALLEELSEPVDGLIIASPANPTGTMASRNDFAEICDYCDRRNIRIISDEIYHGIEFGMSRTSASLVSKNAITVNSFSKYFCMTGWRIGWLVLPDEMVRPIERLTQNLFIAAPTVSQHAAIAALDCYDELDKYVETYAQNREILINELSRTNLILSAPPDGAFYLYTDISTVSSESSEVFCDRLLNETGIAATPGIDFDPIRGRSTVRFSFAASTHTVTRASSILRDWLK